MSNKNVASTVIVVVSLIALIALFTENYVTLQDINPAAAIAAVTVALIGIMWFKKTAKS
ncbi:MAG: hypothetical protein ABSD42_12175 [Candidatus Bathyarchaeia archaeon]